MKERVRKLGTYRESPVAERGWLRIFPNMAPERRVEALGLDSTGAPVIAQGTCRSPERLSVMDGEEKW